MRVLKPKGASSFDRIALAPWELRPGDFRVFYEIPEAGVVRVLAIGHKTHGELFIGGRRVEI